MPPAPVVAGGGETGGSCRPAKAALEEHAAADPAARFLLEKGCGM